MVEPEKGPNKNNILVLDKKVIPVLPYCYTYDLRKDNMSSSKLTSKFQTTIPKDIRDKLNLKSGDTIVFKIVDDKTIVIKKAKNFDKEYLKATQNTLSEWESDEDEQAFKHLQNI